MKQIKSKKRVRDFGEVYTQEREVKAMLDLAKEESYLINSLFLEPTCGNGNFLVEILKRKLSVSKTKEDMLNALRSIYAIDILEDNINESKKRLYELVKDDLTRDEAFFIMNQNIVCGDSLELLSRSPYTETKFDVVIGNPPYQLSDGSGGNGSSAVPLYHKFVQKAKELSPKYITMIIPSRWFSGGRNLDSFRNEMLNDKHIRNLVDYVDSKECFPGNDIEGGVCYFLWDSSYFGDCSVETVSKDGRDIFLRPLLEDNCDTFIRHNKAISILKKVSNLKEVSFVTGDFKYNPFGFRSSFKGHKYPTSENDITLFGLNSKTFVNINSLSKNKDIVSKYKVCVGKAYGMGAAPYNVINTPFILKPNEICTETYLVLSVCNSFQEAVNIKTYIHTKFFRFLVSLKKISQNSTWSTYLLVPTQDFSKPWTDAELYEKYGLTQEEIDYIESTIRPMK